MQTTPVDHAVLIRSSIAAAFKVRAICFQILDHGLCNVSQFIYQRGGESYWCQSSVCGYPVARSPLDDC